MKRTQLSNNKLDEENSDTLSTNLPGSSYNSFGTHSPALTTSPDHDTDSISESSKKIRKKRNTYQKIDDVTRMKLLDAVQQGETLKAAAKRYDINYSSAKSILHTYRKEGRILKKSAQERIARRRTKANSDLEMSPIYPYKEFQDFGEGPMDFKTAGNMGNEEWNSKCGNVNNNGITINSFGDFLKVDSQGRTKSETSNPTSTIVLKLDSNRFQRVSNNNSNMNNISTVPTIMPTTITTTNTVIPPMVEPVPVPVSCNSNVKSVQSGNWKLNVNVQRDNTPKSTVKTFNSREGNRITYNFTTNKVPETKNVESFHINFSTSSQSDSKFLINTTRPYNNMSNNHTNNHTVPISNYQQDDVSCFLSSSSPTYPYQSKIGEIQNFEGYQGYAEQQELCGRMNMGNFGRKMEQGTPGLIKTAGLRSY